MKHNVIFTVCISVIHCMMSAQAYANDIEVVELRSVSKPVKNQSVATAEPTANALLKAKIEAEKLVAGALFTLREIEADKKQNADLIESLGKAKAVLIFPNILKVGYLGGGASGKGVLLARANDGKWSYPSFYNTIIVSGGLQIGLQNTRTVIPIMTGKALGAIIDNKLVFSANIAAAIGNKGEAIGYGTTTNLQNDIRVFALNKGVFFGAYINGSSLGQETILNRAFYNSDDANIQTIVINGMYSNRHANALRKYLARFKFQY